MNEQMSDEELIGALEHWGKTDASNSAYSALAIQQRSIAKGRTTLRLTLVACTVIATAIMSIPWRTNFRRPTTSPTEIAMERTPIEPDPELLLKSIAERTRNISARIEGMRSLQEQQRQMDDEIQNLDAKLHYFQRVAIRNQIALNQVP